MLPDVIEATAGDGTLLKSHVILVDPPQGTSTQHRDDPDLGTPDDAITPPESLEQLAAWSTFNGTRKACIDAIARNTVGLGYTLAVAPGHEKDADAGDPTERLIEATARLEALAARDTRLETPSLTELLYAVKTDEEEVGWGFVEVSRNRTNGMIDGLFHLPGKRMRRLQSRKGYLLMGPQGATDDNTYFVPFGTKVVYGDDGLPTAALAPGHAYGWLRNEVLCFKLYSSESRDYGAPRDIALALEHLGDKLAAEANAAYFDNGGALPTVLFVQGEEKREGTSINVTVPAQVTQRIASVLKSKTGVGPAGTGRVAVIPLPAGVKAQKEVLGQISEKDIGHVAFRDDMRQRTMTAFRMSGVFLALADEGRYGAEVDRAITKEQVFDPEQTRYETRLGMILRDLGYGSLAIVFNDLAVEDDAARRSSAEKGSEVGAITNREYREAHKWPPLIEAPAGDEYVWPDDGRTYRSAEPEPGQVPHGWNEKLMRPAGRPDGAEHRVVEGEGQQGITPGMGGRNSRDRGQASSTERQVTRLASRAGRGGARRASERARALPSDE